MGVASQPGAHFGARTTPSQKGGPAPRACSPIPNHLRRATMNKRVHMRQVVSSVWASIALTLVPASIALADNANQGQGDSESQIQRGFQISPPGVLLNLVGKNRALVGLGSYIVNTTGCNDCHTHPSYLPGNDPFLGQPEAINAAQYLTGGRRFGPFTSANLTPDDSGRPAGLTFDQFVSTLRTGHNPYDAPGVVLQVMPWPVIGKKTDRDLHAIHE